MTGKKCQVCGVALTGQRHRTCLDCGAARAAENAERYFTMRQFRAALRTKAHVAPDDARTFVSEMLKSDGYEGTVALVGESLLAEILAGVPVGPSRACGRGRRNV